MGQLIFDEGTAPSTPSTGKVTVYAKTDGLLYFKDDTGAEYNVGSPSQTGNAGKVLKTNGTTASWDGSGVLGTAVASTSGTAIDFTSIPSWVKRVTVLFSSVSTSGSSQLIVQLGDSGGIETTGYQSSASNTADTVNSTVGIVFCDGSATSAGALYTGALTFVNITGTTWIADGSGIREGVNSGSIAGGKTLSSTLDRVRITTAGGTDTFDAGSVNILYE